ETSWAETLSGTPRTKRCLVAPTASRSSSLSTHASTDDRSQFLRNAFQCHEKKVAVIERTPRGMTDAVSPGCVRCPAPATVCTECMRATALMWFGGIARHPGSGTDCQLCAQGLASYCGNCFVEEVASYRA